MRRKQENSVPIHSRTGAYRQPAWRSPPVTTSQVLGEKSMALLTSAILHSHHSLTALLERKVPQKLESGRPPPAPAGTRGNQSRRLREHQRPLGTVSQHRAARSRSALRQGACAYPTPELGALSRATRTLPLSACHPCSGRGAHLSAGSAR